MSLNEYVVSRAVAAAVDDLADRRVFALSPQAWDELQEILDRPATPKPRIAALLAEPSALEAGCWSTPRTPKRQASTATSGSSPHP